MSEIKKLSIVIPCFNEPENVVSLLERFSEVIKLAEHPIEIIIVDGASTDETPKILKKEFKKLDSNIFKLCLMKSRKGYGHDIVYGLKQASGDILSWTHADMQTDPKDILTALHIYESQKTVLTFVKGRRKNRPFLDRFFTFGMQIITRLFLRCYLDDINAQPKLFSKDFFEKYIKDKAPNDFSLDLYALYQAKKNNYQILDFPVYFKARLYGEAKGGGGSWQNRLKLIKRTLVYIFKLRKKL